VLSKEFENCQTPDSTLGQPLQRNNLDEGSSTVTKAADARRIKFHGLRHTSATLMLQAGEPVNVVQEHLGHHKVEITLNVYAHVLKAMETRAVARRATWLTALPG
jgi:integrase